MDSRPDLPRHTHRACAVAGLLALALLGGCGGSSEAPSPRGGALPAPKRTVIEGRVAKGPLIDATVRLYALDGRGFKSSSEPLAETRSDAQGNWSVSLAEDPGAVLVESTGGRYVDESDPEPDPARKRVIAFAEGEGLHAVLPAGEAQVALTVYSQALLEKARFETVGEEFLEVLDNNRQSALEALGFDPFTTVPADPVAPDLQASEASRRYAMALGGAANALNAVAIALGRAAADFAMVEALVSDLADCRLDGRGLAGPVVVALQDEAVAMPSGIDLDREILRFRNNNFEYYETTSLVDLDEAACARSGATADRIPPVIEGLPEDFTVAAIDASGTPASDPDIASRLDAVSAEDDRSGNVEVSHDAPEVFPLGATWVGFTARDLAGNASRATVEVTVTDQTPPSIVAPDDLVVAQAGALTLVDLGEPTVGDNVTPGEALEVGHDAPPEGFTVGVHTVLWSVADAAGLSAEAAQTVTVLSTTEDGDSDGLADARELDYGTDPDNPDSDGDGVGDGLEVDVGSDPTSQATAVLYVSPDGDNANTGDDWSRAKADNLGLGVIPAGESASRPTFVLYQSNLPEPADAWALALGGDCDHIVLLGSMEPGRALPRLADGGGPSTTFNVESGRALSLEGCDNVHVRHVEITGATSGGVHVSGGSAVLDGLRLRDNTSDAPGGGLSVSNARVELRRSVVAGNWSAVDGGGIFLEGAETEASIEHCVVSGNEAARMGGGMQFAGTGPAVRVLSSLITANIADSGGGLGIAAGASLVANATVAFNEARDADGGAGLGLTEADAAPQVSDSILVFNRDRTGNADAYSSNVTPGMSSFNLIEGEAVGLGDLEVSVEEAGLVSGFFLDQTASPAVDSGSTLAAVVGLDDAYTDPDSGDPRTDSDILDRGFHYQTPYHGPADSFLLLIDGMTGDTVLEPGTPALVVPTRTGVHLGTGHEVIVTLDVGLVELHANVDLDPLGDHNSVFLTDLGNGEYRFVFGKPVAPGETALRVYVDDLLVDVPVTVVVLGCAPPSACKPPPDDDDDDDDQHEDDDVD